MCGGEGPVSEEEEMVQWLTDRTAGERTRGDRKKGRR